jgi:osmotically inducible protein OsmC
MKYTAQVHWQGNLKEGKGTLSTESGVLDEVNYSYKTRFEEEEVGTNPEELLAAAHGGCFTMAVSSALTRRGLNPVSLDTEVNLTMEKLAITAIHLAIIGSVPGINEAEFIAVANDMGKNCIVSKALNVQISTEAKLRN